VSDHQRRRSQRLRIARHRRTQRLVERTFPRLLQQQIAGRPFIPTHLPHIVNYQMRLTLQFLESQRLEELRWISLLTAELYNNFGLDRVAIEQICPVCGMNLALMPQAQFLDINPYVPLVDFVRHNQ